MNNNSKEIQQSVTALLKADNKLKAVEIFKQNGVFKLLWAKSGIENDLNWHAFAAGCGLSAKAAPLEQVNGDKSVVVGYDSTGTAFYRVNVPVVEEKEVSAIVRLQAESRFPLHADQMELAWRTNKPAGGQMAITIAAARSRPVLQFIDKVRNLHPVNAILDSEAIVKVWTELFSGHEQNTVIINAGTHSTQICLAQKGLLSNAVTLDMGTVDFGEGESQDETETIERLARDTRSVVDLFNVENQFEMPVIVLSDGGKIYETLAASLRSAGMNARPATPSVKKLKSDDKFELKEIFEYRLPIGLALMALDGKTDALNLFARFFKSTDEEVKKHWFYSLKITGAVAAAMVLLFALVSYGVVVAGTKVINDKLVDLGSETKINTLVEKQKLIKEIASQRVDMIALLTEINRSGQSDLNSGSSSGRQGSPRPGPQPAPPGKGGIQLESVHFKKGQRVTITGQVQNKEQLENFEKSLAKNRDIRDILPIAKSNTGPTSTRNQGARRGSANNVRGNNPQPAGPARGAPGGAAKKGFTYTITFHYKNLTGSKSK